MFKKENRLSADKDFQRVFKGSRPVHTQNLVLRVAKQSQASNLKPQNYGERSISGFLTKSGMTENPKKLPVSPEASRGGRATSYKPESRFGFVISNKINKLATRRNALKRQLRAVIEKSLPDIKPGYNIVIMVKRDFDWPYQQKAIEQQVEEGLRRAGILKISN